MQSSVAKIVANRSVRNLHNETTCSTQMKSKTDQEPPHDLDKTDTGGSSSDVLLNSKTSSNSIYDVEQMTNQELRDSLRRVKENPIQPFSFLECVYDEISVDDHTSKLTRSTEIDIQLATLKERIELNQALLKQTDQQIKDIDFVSQRNDTDLKILSYDEDIFLDMKNETKGQEDINTANLRHSMLSEQRSNIEKFRQTLNTSMEMLKYVKPVSTAEINFNDLPVELAKRFQEISKKS